MDPMLEISKSTSVVFYIEFTVFMAYCALEVSVQKHLIVIMYFIHRHH